MNVGMAAIALISGYLLGSISFARFLGKWFAPGEDLSTTEVVLSESGGAFEMHSVSATSLAFRKGPRAGCLVSILDMLKATIPVLVFKTAFPEMEYFWFTAAGAVIGHNFPIYYRFKGGRGMSPLYGGLFVIDWLAIPVTTVTGMLLGVFILRDMFAAWTLGVPLLIVWMAYKYRAPVPVVYSVLVTIAFLVAIYPELKVHLKNRRDGSTEPVNVSNFFSGASNMFVRRGGRSDTNSDPGINAPRDET
jgi:glycerol-3-phosphate acyltransferase PlsY